MTVDRVDRTTLGFRFLLRPVWRMICFGFYIPVFLVFDVVLDGLFYWVFGGLWFVLARGCPMRRYRADQQLLASFRAGRRFYIPLDDLLVCRI